MRIIHVLNHVRNTGNGIVNATIDLVCSQKQMGEDVAVASSGGEFTKLLEQYGIPHYQLKQEKRGLHSIRTLSDFNKIMKEFNPDIVHAQMVTGALLAKILKIKHSYKLVTTVHNIFDKQSMIMGVGDRVIAVSNSVSEILRNKKKISPNKVRTVLNGTLNSPRTKKLEDYMPISLDGRSIVTVAGMNKRKGITELIKAFEIVGSKHTDANLYLVGDGPDRPFFEEIASNSINSNRIHFIGFEPEPQKYLLSADIFVLFSYRESCPLVLFEAREAGCAIIASNVDGIPEVLNNESGILIKPGDIIELAEKIDLLFSDTRELTRLKLEAKKDLEKLSVNRVCEETLTIYKELAV